MLDIHRGPDYYEALRRGGYYDVLPSKRTYLSTPEELKVIEEVETYYGVGYDSKDPAERFPFLVDVPADQLERVRRDISVGNSTNRVSVFELCLSLGKLGSLKDQFLQQSPPHLDIGIRYVNDRGCNLFQDAAEKGKPFEAIDFVETFYPITDLETEANAVRNREISFTLLENSGNYRLNALRMAAEAGSLHEFSDLVSRLSEYDRNRTIKLFKSGEHLGSSGNVLHPLFWADNIHPGIAPMIGNVFQGEKKELRDLVTEKDISGNSLMDNFHGRHSNFVYDVFSETYRDDPDYLRELLIDLGINPENFTKSLLFPLTNRATNEQLKLARCLLRAKGKGLERDSKEMARLIIYSAQAGSLQDLESKGDPLIEHPNLEALLYPGPYHDPFKLGLVYRGSILTHVRNMESFDSAMSILTAASIEEPDVVRGIIRNAGEVFWSFVGSNLDTFSNDQLNNFLSVFGQNEVMDFLTRTKRTSYRHKLVERMFKALQVDEKIANTSFQMGRFSDPEAFAREAFEVYIESKSRYKEEEDSLRGLRGSEMILSLGPTQLEAKSAFDSDTAQIRAKFHKLLGTAFALEGAFYNTDGDERLENIQEGKDAWLALFPIDNVGHDESHVARVAADRKGAIDKIGTVDPLTLNGFYTRRLVWGGEPADRKEDEQIRKIFPISDFPMLHKPDINYLPMPILPEHWQDFALKLVGRVPDFRSDSFTEAIQVTASLQAALRSRIEAAGGTLNEATDKALADFSKRLSKYFIDIHIADQQTRELQFKFGHGRPVVVRVLDPVRDEHDLLDFLRYPFAGDPLEKIDKHTNNGYVGVYNNAVGQSAADPYMAVAIFYENKSGIEIKVNDRAEEDLDPDIFDEFVDADEPEDSLEEIQYDTNPLAFGYATITEGMYTSGIDSDLQPVVIIGDAELGAYRGDANVANILLNLAIEVRKATGFPVIISSAYGKVFEQEMKSKTIDLNGSVLSHVPKAARVKRKSAHQILDNTGIPVGQEVYMHDQEAPFKKTAAINNWFIVD